MKTVAFAVAMSVAVVAKADCVGRPSLTLRGWKMISAWTLPGDLYGVTYACSDANRKLIVERFASRTTPDVRYVSDIEMPKLPRGEILIGGGDCTLGGAQDPYLIPFGMYTAKGVPRVKHAWRVELPNGTIRAVDASSVRCPAR